MTTPASIVTFQADKMAVNAGERVTISWKVTNASSVTITAAPGGVLVNASTMLEGTVMSGEITAQTVFTILAKGVNGGSDAMKPITVTVTTPAAVSVDMFTATPMTVKPGDPVTLSWTTSNATSVQIDVVNGSNVLMGGPAMGTTTVNPTVSSSYVIVATGADGTTAMQTVQVTVEGTPVINSFTATPMMIELGGMATLSWDIMGAATVIIRDAAGTEVHNGSMATGSIMVSPTMTTQYTLVARSTLGQEVTMMASVTVNRAAIVTEFSANPTTVDYGDPTELRWTVDRAPGGVTISADGVVIHTNPASMGTFTVTATRTTTYTLTAINPDGDTTAMATVTVNPAAPRFVSFTVSPNPARIGDQATLDWAFNGATSVRVLDANNTELTSVAGGTGTFAVTVTATSAVYTVEAINPNGTTRSTVTLIGQNDPVIRTLEVTPATFTDTTTIVTVTFETDGATSTQLTLNGVAAPGFSGTATGTYTFTATTTVRITLTAINAVGQSSREISVLRLAGGAIDPGNTSSTALSLDGFPGAAQEIRPAGDRDRYSFLVPAGGNVRIEVSDGNGGCTFDSFIELIGPDGTTVVGTDDDDGIANCSLINPRNDAFAANMPAGRYYVVVRGFAATATFDYVVTVTPGPAACGNGIFEASNAEQCDDTNTASGDGCSATCRVEPIASVGFPANQTVAGSITPAGNADYVEVVLPADGYIGAEVFIPARGRCDSTTGNSADPVLTLFDSNFNVIGSDNDDGISSCARIDPNFDAFAAVPAGTYYLRVTESGNDGVIPTYVLDVRTLGRGCGNAILEGAEECDDGNGTTGDGCNLTCEFEGAREIEPNNTFATATPLVVTSTRIAVRGTLAMGGPADSADFFVFDVPAGSHIDAFATVNGLTDCPETPEVIIALFNPAGTQIGTSNSTGGPQGNCGRVWPYTVAGSRAVAAGRYGIRVTSSANTPVPVYFLQIQVIAPGCGNTIIEGTEQCEDGNTVSGDGCSATCEFEPVQTIALGAGTTATVAGVISPEYNRDAVRLTVTGTTVFLRAETFVDAATGLCPSISTRLRLFDDAGVELGNDAFDGVGSCSLINPQLDAFAALDPGNYWLVVEEEGNNALVNRYELVVTGIAANQCGNGIIEPNRGEECDGQTFCNAQCQIVPIATITGPTANQTINGAITPIGDLDFIEVTTTAPAYIIVETGIPTIGTCPTGDTLVRLFDAASGAELFSDDDDGPGACSLLPGVGGPAPLVQPGTYLVRVEEFSNDATIAAYQVNVRVEAVGACGNTIRETGEQCDDGNTAAGDGCSATCAIEPDGVVNAPGTQVFTGAIDPINDSDIYQIVLAAPSVVSVETGIPTIGTCPTGATVLTLTGPTGTTIETDSTDGPGSCSLIGERILPAGTYTVTVNESGNDALIAAYALQIVVTSLPAAVEGTYTAGAPAATFAGALTVGEIDVYRVTAAAGGLRLNAENGAPTFGTCPSADTVLRVFDANGVQLAEDDQDGVNSCSLIGATDNVILAPGDYYVVVEDFGRNTALAAYEVRVEAVVNTPCGNGTREATEQCDDGNNAAGDGCSATCTAEAPGTIVIEVEPNNTPATGTLIGTFNAATTVDASASLTVDDLDFYRFVTTVPLNVQIATYTRLGGVLTQCTTDTELFLYNGIPTDIDATVTADEPTLVDYSDDDSVNACSIIAGTNTAPARVLLPPGTYYVQARHFSGTAVGNYFVRFDFAP